MSQRDDALPEPILIAEFKKNRAGDTVRVYLKNYEGHALIDVRTWWPDGGVRKPGKGFACLAKHLPTLLEAFTKATAKARELDLIEAEPAP